MKLNNASNTVLASEGVTVTSAFNIARTPHMFNILSSGLYSDKVAAVLREIGCNAMDAHIMFGTPHRPIEVKLPTALDRSFYVKDWGPGLDDTEFRQLYTTYGWSNKQNDETVTGAFGLGSKSPFAYTLQNEDSTDGFTVESVKNGVKRIYTCYIGTDGGPAVSMLYEGASDEDWQHGVKVTFPVQERDVTEFHQKAREVFQYFSVIPHILGLSGGVVVPPSYKWRGSAFGISEESKEPAVVMGGVRYPIVAGRIRELTPEQSALLDAGICLHVPMGTVMMTPSRETLEYTEHTRQGVRAYLTKAVHEVANTIREHVTTPEPTRWAWFRKIHAYADTLPLSVRTRLSNFLVAAGMSQAEVSDLVSVVSHSSVTVPKWLGDGAVVNRKPLRNDDGHVLRDQVTGETLFDPEQDLRGCSVYLYQASPTGRNGKTGVKRTEIIGGGYFQGQEYKVQHVPFMNGIEVAYVDCKSADARAREAIRSHAKKILFVAVPHANANAEFARDYVKRLCTTGDLEGLPYTALSTYPVPERLAAQRAARKSRKGKTLAELMGDTEVQYGGSASSAGAYGLRDTELKDVPENGRYYVQISRMDQSFYRHIMSCVHTDEAGLETRYNFTSHTVRNVWGTMFQLARTLNLPLEGAVVVEKESHVKRLKLKELGYKPLIHSFVDMLKDPAVWKKAVAMGTNVPKIDFNSMYYADDWSLIGVLGYHSRNDTTFWKDVKAISELAPWVEVAACLQKEQKPENSQLVEFLTLLRNGYSHSQKFGLESLTSVTAADFNKLQFDSCELLSVLDTCSLGRMSCESSDSENYHRVLSTLRLVASLTDFGSKLFETYSTPRVQTSAQV